MIYCNTTTVLSDLRVYSLVILLSNLMSYCTCEIEYERSNKNWFWSTENSGEVLSRLESRGFVASSLSTYEISILYTIPHNVIKRKNFDLVEWTFDRVCTF